MGLHLGLAVAAVSAPAVVLGQIAGTATLVVERKWSGPQIDTILPLAPTGAALHSSGTFVLTLPQLSRVLLGHLDTEQLEPLGRVGQGPGEYLRPVASGWLGDSLWIWDSGLRRLNWLTRTGRYLGAEPGRGMGSLVPLRGGRWYRFVPGGVNDTVAQAILTGPDQATAERVTSYSWPKAPELRIPLEQGFIVGVQPFANRAFVSVDLATEDLLVFQPLREPGVIRYRRIRPNGTTQVDRRVSLPVQALTENHYQTMIDRWKEEGGPRYRALEPERLRKAFYRPKYLPTIRGIVRAGNGTVWLQAGPETEQVSTWVELSKDGLVRRQVTGPPELQLLLVAGGRAVGSLMDENGVVSLVLFRIVDS